MQGGGKQYAYAVQTGRRDGNVSVESEARSNLPGHELSASQAITKFKAKGLSASDTVLLLGRLYICLTIYRSYLFLKLISSLNSFSIDRCNSYLYILYYFSCRGSHRGDHSLLLRPKPALQLQQLRQGRPGHGPRPRLQAEVDVPLRIYCRKLDPPRSGNAIDGGQQLLQADLGEERRPQGGPEHRDG